MGKNFAMIGCGGYIAPRHLRAIKNTGNNLVAALDKSDSVGILDKYFDDAHFFTEFERFDRHVEKLKRLGKDEQIHYVSICSPNYLHDSHIRFGLRVGADVICEKPLVINPWNLEGLKDLESETGKKVNAVLQLRMHPSIIELKKIINNSNKKHDVELTYIAPRGRWYSQSWKGDESKSGGLIANIGIHFFDALTWIFGNAIRTETYLLGEKEAGGYLELEKANVRWYLSTRKEDLPDRAIGNISPSYKSLRIDGEEIEFSDGFSDLHTKVYEDVLNGKGIGVDEARNSIELVHKIRTGEHYVVEPSDIHYMLRGKIKK